MKKQTIGMMIAALRKEEGMTQLDLAEKIGLTAGMLLELAIGTCIEKRTKMMNDLNQRDISA